MTDTAPNYENAETLRKNKQFKEAADQFSILWQQKPNQMIGWRYTLCLRKLGQLGEAEQVARSVVEKYPNDKWSIGELIWVLYYKELKPAKEESDLGRILHVANEIMALKPDGLALQKVVLAVMKVAKGRGKWATVLEWADKVQPKDLSLESVTFEGKRGMSDRETWYVGRARALLELEHYSEAREQARVAMIDCPDEVFLGRTAALALARSGDVQGGTTELRALLTHRRADWYVKADLAELEHQLGNHAEAYRLMCEAISNPQDDQYKLGYFVTLARIALTLGKLDVAIEHIALAKAIRIKENWSIPSELMQIEKDTRAALSARNQVWPELPDEVRQLSKICRQRWREGTTAGLERCQGTVKPYRLERKYTFIKRDDGGKDVYVLIRDLPKDCVKEGAKVDFVLKPSFDREGKPSFQAIDVCRAPE